jgi:hypothetical protein
MKQTTALVSALLLLLTCLLSAQQNFKKVGTSGYVFLEIPVTARTLGMGEASVTMNDGAQGVFSNPALLGNLRHEHSAGISFANWFAETQHQAFAYAMNLGSSGTFGVSVDRLDFGTMTRTEDGQGQGLYNVLGTFSADAMAIGATYSRAMTDRFSFGGTVKYVSEKIAEFSSTNMVVDAGVLYNTGFHTLKIGGVIRNFGVDSKYLVGLFKMPTEFRLGASAEVLGDETADSRVTVAVEATHPSDNDERLNVGVEYCLMNFISLRGGYKFNYDEESWTAGLGLFLEPVTVDLAYADYGRLEGILRLSVSVAL